MSKDDKPPYVSMILAALYLGAGGVLGLEINWGLWMVVGGLVLLAGVAWLMAYWMTDSMIRMVRRLDPEERQVALAAIADAEIQREVQQGLDEDPIGEGMAPVERFSFPRRMTRHLMVAYVVGAVVAVSGAVLASLTTSRNLRLTGAATALVAALATIGWGWWRSRLLASAIEISPFAISEVWPDGSRRTMLWRDVWWLRNRPRLGRLEVLGADRRTGIHLHHDRVAFNRAAGLVVDYGGFGPPHSGQPS